MKPNVITIKDAIKQLRPNDNIVKILSNKFAIVNPAYTDGTFDVNTLIYLDNGIIYSLGYAKNIKKFYQENYKPLPNFKKTYTYLINGKVKTSIIDYRKTKHTYRKAIQLLEQTN